LVLFEGLCVWEWAELYINEFQYVEIRNILHDHVYNEQTNEEILLINKMYTKLKERIWNI